MNIEPGLDPADFPEYGAPTLAGDHSDDDGQVIDSLFVEVDTPPTPPADTPAITHRTMPRRTNQLIEGFQVIDLNNLNTPMRLLNADPDRKDTIVRVNCTVATDSIRIADEPSKLSYPPAGGTSG